MTASSGGEARDNARRYTSYDTGMCQQFVRGPCWEVGSLYGSAIEAWNGARQKHEGDRNPPIGAPCYYRGGSYGHVVIYVGNGNVRSTDTPSRGSVGEKPLSYFESAWGYTYLGWTGDINGVDLPLSDDPTSGGGDDDVPVYDHASTSVDVDIPTEGWKAIVWTHITGAGNFVEDSASLRIGGSAYSAVLHVQADLPEGATLKMRTMEYDPDVDGIVEENPTTEAVATGGSTYATHVQNGHIASGRRLQFRVNCDKPGGRLLFADATALSWE